VRSSCVHIPSAADSLVKELSSRFPASALMDALGVVYPQYWLQPQAEELFEGHFSVLKNHYCFERHHGDVHSPALLDLSTLNHQCSQFKGAMRANLATVLEKPITVNPLTKLWRTLSMSVVLRKHFPKWFKAAELAAVQVLGSVKDELTFSTVTFSKSRLRNRLSTISQLAWGCTTRSSSLLTLFLLIKSTPNGMRIRRGNRTAKDYFLYLSLSTSHLSSCALLLGR
jgi:hypothetical protein